MTRNVFLGLLLLAGAFASAQEISRMEVFGGYQLFRVSPSSRANVFVPQLDNFNTSGALASFQFNVNTYVGIVSEFGAAHTGGLQIGTTPVSLSQTQLSYMFGPRMFVHFTNRIVPFMECLAGAVHNARTFVVPNELIPPGSSLPRGVTADPGSTSTAFHTTESALAIGIGTGVDVKFTKHIGVRVIEVEYVGTHLAPLSVPGVPAGINDSAWQMNWKYSTGVKFSFGGVKQIETQVAR